ncbi:MAG TPA: orotate phosphoribosyltransferase [Acidimicrobiaceae bacterium]|nr:orotate phosphoribosyltransferase [Acidimicrobiaceae bacterium]
MTEDGLTVTGAARNALIAHLMQHSIRTGEFTLKSGRKSTWFCDAKQTACRPDGILLVANVALAEIAALEEKSGPVTAIGGLTAGADPVAFGIAAVAATRGRDLRSFSIRKESKDHGVQGRLAGALLSGDRVVICEDTVTRGTSPLEAAAVVRELGAFPVAVMPVVDRGGTCGAAANEAGLDFRPLVTAPDLGFPYEGP